MRQKDALLQDVKFSFRALRRRPALSLAILTTLALGIGANSVTFSIVDTVLLQSLPFDAPERLVMIWNRYGDAQTAVSPPDYVDRREQSELLESITAISHQEMNLSGDGEPEQVRVAEVTASFFDVFGVDTRPVPVRFPHEESADVAHVAVLSQGLWSRRFGSDDGLGRAIRLDGESYRVAGVMPVSFDFPEDTDLWIPRQFTPEQLADEFRGNEFLWTVGRLARGVSIDEAQAEMDVIAARVIERVPDRADFLARNAWGASVVPLTDELVGSYRSALFVIWGAVGLVLLIACGNVANLLLASSESRARELSVRTAIGASRYRIAQQLLTEAFVLSFLGAGLGLLLAVAALRILPTWIPHELPRLEQVSLDPRVVGFTLLLAIGTAIAFGLAPAWRAAVRRTSGRRMRRALVVNEVAIAVLLMIGAGLLLKSFRTLTALDPGFDAERRLSFRVTLPPSSYPNGRARAVFTSQVLDRLRALPGVRSAGSSYRLPLDGEAWTATFFPEHYEDVPGEPTPGGDFNVVSPGYLEALGIPLLRGRDFAATDDENAPEVVLIDRSTAERYWPDGKAVGSRITFQQPGPEAEFREIVGIVGRVKNDSLDEDGRSQIYLPAVQSITRSVSFTLESEHEPLVLIGAIRSEIAAIDPELPLYNIRGLEELVADAVALPRFNVHVLGGFALLALLLAALGVYAVLSYSVSTRTAEIGLRMALGARASTVMRLVLREGLGLVALGLVLGLLSALLLTRFAASLLYGVAPTDTLTFVAVSLALFAAGSLAAFLPARRAARLDPVKALRF